MALRAQPQVQDSSLEDSRHEAESLEGRKAAAQADVLAIAENKKQIEADKHAISEKLDSDIFEKKRQLQRTQETHTNLLEVHAREREAAERALSIARSAVETVEKNQVTLQTDYNVLSDKKRGIEQSIVILCAQESKIKASITNLQHSLEADEKRAAIVANELTTAETKLELTKIAYSKMQNDMASEREEHSSLLASKESKQKEFADLDLSIDEKTKRVSDLSIELTELANKKQQSIDDTAMQDAKSNDRLAAASRLEQRVDGKLAQLKEAEAEFTTEHLARIGYQKIGST